MPIEMQSKLPRLLQVINLLAPEDSSTHSGCQDRCRRERSARQHSTRTSAGRSFYRLSVVNVNVTAAARPPGRYPLLGELFIDKYRNDAPQDIHAD